MHELRKARAQNLPSRCRNSELTHKLRIAGEVTSIINQQAPQNEQKGRNNTCFFHFVETYGHETLHRNKGSFLFSCQSLPF
jgi:hypothetical protein